MDTQEPKKTYINPALWVVLAALIILSGVFNG